MPRPKKSDATIKDEFIHLRVDRGEKIKAKEFAKMSGMTVTDFIKARLFNKPPRTKVANLDREVLIKYMSELGRLGSNVNQIAKHMNSQNKTFYSVTVKETYIAEVLLDLRKLFAQIQNELEHGQQGGDPG
jgi:hypothetical protein